MGSMSSRLFDEDKDMEEAERSGNKCCEYCRSDVPPVDGVQIDMRHYHVGCVTTGLLNKEQRTEYRLLFGAFQNGHIQGWQMCCICDVLGVQGVLLFS